MDTVNHMMGTNNERGALDLSSIMIGVIAVGIIGGVAAAAVFAVIPWAQDNAAKQQLSMVNEAQKIYYIDNGVFAEKGELINEASASATSAVVNSTITDDIILGNAKVPSMSKVDQPVAIVLNNSKQCFVSVIKSDSGKYFYITDESTSPQSYVPRDGESSEPSVSADCVSTDYLEEHVKDIITLPVVAEPTPEPTTPDPTDPGTTEPTTPGPTEPVVEKRMITTWDTAASKTVTLPLTGAVDVTVNWGDGSAPQRVTTANPAHTYPTTAPAVSTVTIDGTFNGWSTGASSSTNPSKVTQLLTVERWDDTTGTTNLSYAFREANKLTKVSEIPNTTTDLTGAFQTNTTFNGNISTWETANVTTIRSIFSGASEFNQNISAWDTSNVADMTMAFYQASKFDQPLNTWNTSNVQTMNGMFTNATNFNKNLSTWDVSKVVTTAGMFNNAVSFNYTISPWKTASLTNTSFMFDGATAFAQNMPYNSSTGAWDVSKVTNMSAMYRGSGFIGNLTSWNTSSVTDMSSMFQNTRYNLSLNTWNTANVTNMSSMFSGNPVYNRAMNTWNTANVPNMSFMFADTSAFNQNISTWTTANVTNMNSMFRYATAFNQNISGWNVLKVTSYGKNEFNAYSALTTANSPIKSW